MKLQQEESDIESVGEFVSHEATIAVGKHAFNLLSKGLYSNPFRAIVRELACNAWDAHIAAGTTDKPFEVYLPNVLAPTFKIRDFGTGMTDDFVLKIYNSYFTSTKQESDAMTGCFGLGSKSPYAYTKKFTVISYYNGVRSHFISFLNARGIPETTKMSAEPTDEPNGMEISIAVEPYDFGSFIAAAKSCLLPFALKPIIHGITDPDTFFKELPTLLTGNGWRVLKTTNSYGYHPTATMGNVDYPVSGMDSSYKGFSKNAQKLLSLAVVVDFPVGAFEITPSRESIQWSEYSVQNVSDRLEEVYDEIVESVNAQIATAPTMWEASRAVMRLVTNGPLSMLRIEATWNGQEVLDTFKVPAGYKITLVRAAYPRRDGSGTVTSKNSAPACLVGYVNPGDGTFLFSDFNGTMHRVQHHVRNNVERDSVFWVLSAIKEVDRINPVTKLTEKVEGEDFDPAHIATFCQLFGIATTDVKLASSIPAPPRKVVERKSKLLGTQARAFVYDMSGYGENGDNYWKEADVDLAATPVGVYVEINKWNFVGSKLATRARQFKQVYRDLSGIGFNLPVEGLIGVKTADLKKFEKAAGWKKLDDVVLEHTIKYWQTPGLQRAHQIMACDHHTHNSYFRELATWSKKHKGKFPAEFTADVEVLWNAVHLSNNKLALFLQVVNSFYQNVPQIDLTTVPDDVVKLVSRLTQKYPLLPAILTSAAYGVASTHASAIIEYINLIETHNQVPVPEPKKEE